MRLGVHSLLADESLHIAPQLIVFDQRQGVLERVDDELLTRRQQQMQHVAEVGGEGLVRHVVERQRRPVEVDVTRLQDDALVIERGVMRARCHVIDGEHRCHPLSVLGAALGLVLYFSDQTLAAQEPDEVIDRLGERRLAQADRGQPRR